MVASLWLRLQAPGGLSHVMAKHPNHTHSLNVLGICAIAHRWPFLNASPLFPSPLVLLDSMDEPPPGSLPNPTTGLTASCAALSQGSPVCPSPSHPRNFSPGAQNGQDKLGGGGDGYGYIPADLGQLEGRTR